MARLLLKKAPHLGLEQDHITLTRSWPSSSARKCAAQEAVPVDTLVALPRLAAGRFAT